MMKRARGRQERHRLGGLMKLWSDSWANGERIPERYAAGRLAAEGATFADNVSPHLAWSDLPAGTRSLALICHDFDVPSRATTSTRPAAKCRPTCRGSTSSTGCWSTCRRAPARSPPAPSARASRCAASPGPAVDVRGLHHGAPRHQRLHRLVRRQRRDGRRLLRLRRPVPAVERLADPPLRLHAVCARRRQGADRGRASPVPRCARRSIRMCSARRRIPAPTR